MKAKMKKAVSLVALKIPLLALLSMTQTACTLSSLLGMMSQSISPSSSGGLSPASISSGASGFGIQSISPNAKVPVSAMKVQSISDEQILAHAREVEAKLNGPETVKAQAQVENPPQENTPQPAQTYQFRKAQAAIPPVTRAPASVSQAAR